MGCGWGAVRSGGVQAGFQARAGLAPLWGHRAWTLVMPRISSLVSPSPGSLLGPCSGLTFVHGSRGRELMTSTPSSEHEHGPRGCQLDWGSAEAADEAPLKAFISGGWGLGLWWLCGSPG